VRVRQKKMSGPGDGNNLQLFFKRINMEGWVGKRL